MKKILALAVLGAVTLNVPASAYSQRGYSEQCFRQIYREEYVPGNRRRPGRVRRWTENVEVPCHRPQRYPEPRYHPRPQPQPQRNTDDNSCIEGAILGGLGGGAAGAALSRGEGMIYGIPLGIIGGVLIGCQLDGG